MQGVSKLYARNVTADRLGIYKQISYRMRVQKYNIETLKDAVECGGLTLFAAL